MIEKKAFFIGVRLENFIDGIENTVRIQVRKISLDNIKQSLQMPRSMIPASGSSNFPAENDRIWKQEYDARIR
jgi:hypothetical protein